MPIEIILLWTLTNAVNFAFAGFAAGKTLNKKYSNARTYLSWTGIALVVFALSFFIYKVNILNDTEVSLLILAIGCVSIVLLYKDSLVAKLFVGMTMILFTTILIFAFCGTADQIWGARLNLFDPVNGPYTVRNILFFTVIKLLVLSSATTLYLVLLKNSFIDLLTQAKDQLRKYLIAPVVSYIGFSAITYISNSVGILPDSPHFLPLYASICTILVVEYIMIFNSVHWASEAIQADKKVHMDGLTGLDNRLAFAEKEEVMTEEMRKGNAVFGIIMIDLNFLKKLNDTYGHERGDFALETLAGYIRDVFKGCENYRIGGDEFAVLALKDKVNELSALTEKFKQTLIDKEGGQPWESISAAIGYAIYDKQKDRSFDDVYKRADAAMYAEKTRMKGGRDD